MKTAVEAIFVGKARQYNRRFLQMCSHHLIEPVARTPASGWEKGQVKNQVGNLRDQLSRPKPRAKSLTELNARPNDHCPHRQLHSFTQWMHDTFDGTMRPGRADPKTLGNLAN